MTRRRFEWTSTRWISTPQKPVLASWVYLDRQRFGLGLPRIAQRLDRLDGLFAFGVDLAADQARDLVPDVIDIDGLVPVGGETAGLLRSAEQVGLIWQFVLVVILIWREQRSLRWSRIRDALWLRSPRSPRSGRTGGRVWLVVIPLMVAYAAVPFVFPSPPSPEARDFGLFLESDAGQSLMSGNWLWFGLLVVLWVFNTVLGEELLFRGLLLPRMNGAFGRGDWVANGVLFAAYHLHVPWVIPETLLADTLIVAYPAKRYRSAWIGIVVHSAQSVVLAIIVLTLVV
jgi:uncharacterized protein